MARDVSRLPVARPMSEFVVERLEGEVLVYDQIAHQAHCLSPSAAMVWERCDGASDSRARAVAALVAAGSNETVDSILPLLQRAGLLKAERRSERVNTSRRRMLGKTAVAAGVIIASPVVYSIISPSVAQAASTSKCGAKTQPCCTGKVCNSGLRCSSSSICQ